MSTMFSSFGAVIQPVRAFRLNLNFDSLNSKSASSATLSNTYTREAPNKLDDFRAEKIPELLSTTTSRLAERAKQLNDLRKAAAELKLPVKSSDLVGLSVGTAFCPEDGFEVERLLAEADRRMYSMKKIHHLEGAPDLDPNAPAPRSRSATVN